MFAIPVPGLWALRAQDYPSRKSFPPTHNVYLVMARTPHSQLVTWTASQCPTDLYISSANAQEPRRVCEGRDQVTIHTCLCELSHLTKRMVRVKRQGI